SLIALRMVWVLAFGELLFHLTTARQVRNARPAWRQSVVIGWAGMRGAVSLAAAQAIPLRLASGAPFPARDLILFFTFVLILVTVVLQGLLLPLLLRSLGLSGRSGKEEIEVSHARLRGARAALERLDELQDEERLSDDAATPTRDRYEHRCLALMQKLRDDGQDNDDGDDNYIDYEARHSALQRLRHELIAAERAALLHIHDKGEISDRAMRRVEHHLDLEESHFEG